MHFIKDELDRYWFAVHPFCLEILILPQELQEAQDWCSSHNCILNYKYTRDNQNWYEIKTR